MKKKSYKYPLLGLLILLLLSGKVMSQTDTLLVQFKEKTNIQYGKFGKDSLLLVMQVKKTKDIFPEYFFIKGKLLGDNSGVLISIPDSLKAQKLSWSFSEYIATADNSGLYIKAKEYASFAYTPFDFSFKTNPAAAEIYMVPLENWEAIFKRSDINFAFRKEDLPSIAAYNILVPSPCTYSVFEQPYIGVFVLGNKIKLTHIRPKRNQPANNKAEINLQ